MKKLLLGYIALVLSFQYEAAARALFGPFLGAFGPPMRQVAGWFLFWLILFWGLAVVHRRVAARSASNDDEDIGCGGCLTALVVLLVAAWMIGVLAFKVLAYQTYDAAAPTQPETAPAEPTSLDPDDIAFFQTLLRHEAAFDALVQFWMPPHEPYFLDGVVRLAICHQHPQFCSGATP